MIIVTLTTIPNRLLEERNHMGSQHALLSILNQSYPEYEVHFNVPNSYNKIDIELPDWVLKFQEKYNHFKIFRTEDYGPVTKILPTLERGGDPEDIIITVDDDLIYMNGFIEAHLKGRKKYPDCALGFAGLAEIGGENRHFATTVSSDARVKILEGYKTVSYTRKFFDVDEFKSKFALKTWSDDHALSAYMGYKEIKKYVLHYEKDTDFSPRVESFPVKEHAKVEAGGCRVFRDEEDRARKEQRQTESHKNIQNFYKIGYLER